MIAEVKKICKETLNMSEHWNLVCSGHTYITLNCGEKFVYCFDNDILRFSFIKTMIEKRTRMKWDDIPKSGEWNGLGEYGTSGEKYLRL